MKYKLKKLDKISSKIQHKISFCMRGRLGTLFMAFIFLFFINSDEFHFIALTLLGTSILGFIFFYRTHHRLKNYESKIKQWIYLLERIEGRKGGNYKEKSSWIENDFLNQLIEEANQDPQEIFAKVGDFHLVGEKSLLALLDECLTPAGKTKLLKKILFSDDSRQQALETQKRIQRLAPHLWFFQKTIVSFKDKFLDFTFTNPKQLLKNSLINKTFLKLFYTHIFASLCTWGAALLALFHILPIHPLTPFLFYFIFTLIASTSEKSTFEKAQNMFIHSEPFFLLLNHFHKYNEHPAVKEFFPRSELKSLHLKTRQLRVLIGFLSLQGHPMVQLAINLFLPWDYLMTYLVEAWRKSFIGNFQKWSNYFYEWDLFSSYVIFYNSMAQTFPKFTEESKLKAHKIYHPLISKEAVISNDFELNTSTKLALITGSNMSGKSTFLRTLGINHQLALMGCPVFADEFELPFWGAKTCMTVTDNLEASYSTFYFEVRQIVNIVKTASSSQKFIYYIDEIFRGTNNKERLIGSKNVIANLIESSSTMGFITSHDLELTQLETQFSSLKNFHFVDDFRKGHLVFDYKVKEGPSPSTNALKILEREGLRIKT